MIKIALSVLALWVGYHVLAQWAYLNSYEMSREAFCRDMDRLDAKIEAIDPRSRVIDPRSHARCMEGKP